MTDETEKNCREVLQRLGKSLVRNSDNPRYEVLTLVAAARMTLDLIEAELKAAQKCTEAAA